ncbi:energy transducer TonB [Elizabethkingia meningoseptica]|uniref:hypothetical protein n=1 Tax=Elizabethkingia meningoseptica TaxID=238 RepID=UPI003891D053
MNHKYILLFLILFSGSAFSQEVKNTPTVTHKEESPDNLKAFYNDLIYSFDKRKFRGKGDLSCILYFTIEKDGSMTRIGATGNNQQFNDEVIKTLKRIKTKMKVKTVDGQPVANNYRLPFNYIESM